jgi:hypothetical protein
MRHRIARNDCLSNITECVREGEGRIIAADNRAAGSSGQLPLNFTDRAPD